MRRRYARTTPLCSGAQEVDLLVLQMVDQQKIAADVALAVIHPIAFERVIQTIGAKRRIVGNQQQHGLSADACQRPECDKRCQSLRKALV